jgi:hypothetical protein
MLSGSIVRWALSGMTAFAIGLFATVLSLRPAAPPSRVFPDPPASVAVISAPSTPLLPLKTLAAALPYTAPDLGSPAVVHAAPAVVVLEARLDDIRPRAEIRARVAASEPPTLHAPATTSSVRSIQQPEARLSAAAAIALPVGSVLNSALTLPLDSPPPPPLNSPAPPPINSPAPPVPSVAPAREGGVRVALTRYVRAFEELDVRAAAEVWPSLDREALTRAFATLKSQGLTFNRCDVTVADSSATVRCDGTLEFVRKIGSPAPRVEPQQWLFRMREQGAEWKIDQVAASRSPASS